jgi:hypothetical protein
MRLSLLLTRRPGGRPLTGAIRGPLMTTGRLRPSSSATSRWSGMRPLNLASRRSGLTVARLLGPASRVPGNIMRLKFVRP